MISPDISVSLKNSFFVFDGMNRNIALLLLLLFASASFAYDIELVFFYGQGCSHCAAMEVIVAKSLSEDFGNYSVNIIEKEVYFDPSNRQDLINTYIRFGLDPTKGGVPGTLVNNRSFIIGEITQERFEEIITEHIEDSEIGGIYTEDYFYAISNKTEVTDHLTNPIEEGDVTVDVLLTILGAALIDSVNPCTIAVMVMLLGVVLMSRGKLTMLLSAATFIAVIFICYLLLGLGILTAISEAGLVSAFYVVATIGALLLAIMELNAYFNYKPGFFAVEMPVFMRPVLKGIMKKFKDITNDVDEKSLNLLMRILHVLVVIIGTAAIAVVCSLFLLPCSSGPYLIVLGMLSKAVTLKALFYLILYNIIFVLPMAVIALAIYLGRTTVERVGAMKEKYIKQIHLFSGLVLILLFILMLSKLFELGII